MTSQEAWSGRKSGVGHLRVFESITYAHVTKQRRIKFDDRSAEFVPIGYDSRTKGYKLYDPCSGKITVSRDMEFHEKEHESGNHKKNGSVQACSLKKKSKHQSS